MPAQLKSIMIGLFVISACGLIVFILLFLHPTVGDEAKVLHVRFTDIDKVNIGTRVTFAGRPVGEVTEIREIEGARHTHLEHDGEVYIYELTLKVDSGVYVFNTDEITLRTSGLLGEKNVAILPMPPSEPDEKIYPVDREVFYASSVPSVESTFKDISGLSKKFERALDGVIDILDSIKEKEIVSNIGKAARSLSEITGALDKPEQWENTLANFHTASTNISEAATHAKELMGDGKKIVDKVDTIVDRVAKGEGTLGHLLVGDDLYLRLKSILSKGETVMDDINTYGLLFHSNKKWQRKQAQRMNLVNRLSSPSTFTNHFNDSVNHMSDSLSQVSLVLQESDIHGNPECLIQNPEFTNKFADLLKESDKMQEELKMYNQQLVQD